MAGAHGMLQEKVAIKNFNQQQDGGMCVIKDTADGFRYLFYIFLAAMQSSPACVL